METVELGKKYVAQVKSLDGKNRCVVEPRYIGRNGSIYCYNHTNKNYCDLMPDRIRHEVK